MIEINKENIYSLGDTHSLNFTRLLELYNLKNFVLIHQGDAGEGIEYKSIEEYDLGKLEEYCSNNNGMILIVRGNHTNPEYYNDSNHWTKKYKNIVFVKDYTYYKINDKIFLFAGGAVSIDRLTRKEGEDYWKDEVFVLPDDYQTLPQCDVLITHSTGIIGPPNDGFSRIQYWLTLDKNLKSELIHERENIQKLIDHVKCRCNLYGHFHLYANEKINGVNYRCFNINEIGRINEII